MSKQVKVVFSGDSSGAVRAIKDVDSAQKNLNVGMGDLSKVMYSTFGPLLAGMGIVEVESQLKDAAIASQKMTNAMVASTGSSAAAAQELAFVRSEANRLGLDLLSSADAFTKLTAAAKGTNLEGQATRDIFTAVSGAATSLGLRADETAGALQAIQQMMSKGTVQAEELRGQLGERLPGSFNIAARAMGVTTAELGKMLEQGQVISDDFLPKFAEELKKTFEPTEEMTHSAAAEINRFNTSLYDLKVAVMDGGGVDALNTLVSAGTALVNVTKDGIRLLAEEKLMLQQFATEVAIMMESGENFNRWLMPAGRAELKAELDAAEQMYQYSWNKIQQRYGNAPGIMPEEFVGPPKLSGGGIVKTAGKAVSIKPATYDDPNAMMGDYAAEQDYQFQAALGYMDVYLAAKAERRASEAELLTIEKEMELDAINARVDAYIAGENQKSEALRWYTEQESTMRKSAANNAINLLGVLGQKSKAAALAAMVLQRGLMIGETITSGLAAEIRALAELGPIAGPPAAATIRGWTYANVGLIAATGIAQASMGGGSGSSTQGAGTSTSPVVTQPATQSPVAPSNTVHVTILGNVVDHDKFAREVIPSIQKAFADGVA